MTKRVLVVDDEVLIAMTAVDMVESLGYTAAEAHSGLEALALLADGSGFDLLITDSSMPGMSGAELAREAKRRNPNLAIMVSTGYSELPEEFDDGVQFLSKPYSEQDLSDKMQVALGA